jgi:hypothetical protein
MSCNWDWKNESQPISSSEYNGFLQEKLAGRWQAMADRRILRIAVEGFYANEQERTGPPIAAA